LAVYFKAGKEVGSADLEYTLPIEVNLTKGGPGWLVKEALQRQ